MRGREFDGVVASGPVVDVLVGGPGGSGEPTGVGFRCRIKESVVHDRVVSIFLEDAFGVGADGEERGGEHGQGDVPVPGWCSRPYPCDTLDL